MGPPKLCNKALSVAVLLCLALASCGKRKRAAVATPPSAPAAPTERPAATAVKVPSAGIEWQLLYTEAKRLHKSGERHKAAKLALDALALIDAKIAPPHPDLADNFALAGVTQRALGHHERSKRQLELAKAMREALTEQAKLGPDHPDVAIDLNNLALLYKSQGHYSKAEPLYKRALAIYEKKLGPDHPKVATSLNNLAALYRATKRPRLAEPLESRAKRIGAMKR